MAQPPSDTGEVQTASARGATAPSQDGLKLSNYLGVLREDPDDTAALEGLEALARSRDQARLGDAPVRLLEVARQGHESRGEVAAVARLLEVETLLVDDDPDFCASLWKEIGRVRSELLMDAEGAERAYEKGLELKPGDSALEDALRRLRQEQGSWGKFAKRFVEEAESSTDVTLKTTLLLRAARLVWQYKSKGRDKEVDKLLTRVLEVDPKNVRAIQLRELTLRAREQWQPLSQLLLDAAENADEPADQANFYTRAARLFLRQLDDTERGVACYRAVLELEPAHPEALAYLSERYTAEQRWDDLVALYEGALEVRQKREAEQGMLLQIGMVHWRMRERPEDAEPYFARLRKLDPSHPAMLDYYRSVLDGEERAEERMAVLADAQRVADDPERKLELALEIARILRSTRQQGERAIEAWKLVQRLAPDDVEAAGALKQLYASGEKWNALVDVIKAEIDAVPEDQTERKVALLRELLAVYRDRLHMDGMVINTLNAIAKLAPEDRDTRRELAGKYESMGRWNDLINVLSADAETLTDPTARVDAYLRVASLWIERFSNYNQATGPLERVLEIDQENRSALVQLKDIYEKKRAWKQLYSVLQKERSVASDPAARLDNTVRMAQLAADRLQLHDEAIALWREALAQDPECPGAVEALEKLSERQKDWDTQAEVLETHFRHAEGTEEKIRLLQKLGTLYAERLEDAQKAKQVWRRVLELEPRHGRTLRALRDQLLSEQDWDGIVELYSGIQDWDALVDVLGSEAERIEDPKTKIDLSFRAARVFEQSIGEPPRALRSYERVLSVDPSNVAAARALVPLYEREEKWGRLKGVLEVLLGALDEGARDERLSMLSRLRKLSQDRLRDGEAAFGYAVEAYRLAPEVSGTRSALEAAAEAAAAFDRVLELYRGRLSDADEEEALDLRRRIAAIASDRLSQTDVAAEQHRAVLELRPDDADALAVLERLYRAEESKENLRWLLAHRLGHTDDQGERWAALKELAVIEEEQLGDLDAAAGRYRAMAEIDPNDRDVLVALDRLALAGERWEELARVLERRLDVEEERAVCLELSGRLGLLRLDRLNDPGGALEVFESAIALDASHGTSIAALERMVEEHPDFASRIGRVLEGVYEEGGRFDKLLKVLSRRLEQEEDEEEVHRLRLRLAEISGSKLGDAVGAYGSLEAAFFEHPDDASLWDRLAEVAERAGQHKALANAFATAIEAGDLAAGDAAELAARAARIYDEVLSQPEDAEPLHKRVLAHDPLSEVSFEALKELYTAVERWDDLQSLYRARIAETVDSETKMELLLQLCFLFEEILERPDQAVDAYREVLELNPDHGAARRTLERLYEQTERWRDLAQLLRGNLDQAEGPERVDIMFRLGELHEHKLGEPGAAVEQYEALLTDQPNHMRAQEALARMLGVEGQRQRAAAVLEPLYESQGAYQDLARVLEIQLEEMETPGGRADHLLRIGELHENKTRDSDAAFSAYARAVEAEPSNGAAREALARVAQARESYRRERAAVLERAVEGSSDSPDLQSELLLELAILLDDYLQEQDGAERAYTRLVEVDPDNPDVVLQASRALERIHLVKEDHVHLAEDLARQVRFETDDAVRGPLLVRLGELYETVLDRVDDAITAHRQRLESDPADVDALRALERLYERTERWSDLIEALKGRSDVIDDVEERRELGRRVGNLYEERLEDLDGAIEAYSDVVTSFGPDAASLAALSALYERSGRWNELLDSLEAEADFATDEGQRAELWFRMAEVLRRETGEVERAIERLEQVLDHDPQHVGALAALDAVMGDEESSFRVDAARVAAPRYEASGTYDKLVHVLEVLATTDDPQDRLGALRRAAEVSDVGLSDPSGAFAYMARAVRAGCDDPAIGELLRELERLTEASSRWPDYVALLREVSTEIYDGEVQADVVRQVARVARDRLEDASLAKEYYAKLLEERPEDQEALDALEALHEQTGEYGKLIEVLRRKAELAADPAARQRLLSRQAEIHEQRLDDPGAAIEVLEELLLDAPSEAAYAALERLYTSEKRWEDLGSMYEQQLDRQVGPAVELRLRLARNFHLHLDDTDRALEHLRDAVTDDPGHAGSIELLESIMNEREDFRATAAEILEPGYLAGMQWPKLTAALEARIEAELDVEERKRFLVRLAQIQEDQLEDFDAALGTYARLFADDPRDEEVWETLTRLAKVGGQWSRLGKILSEPLGEGADDAELAKLAVYTGQLYEERLHNQHRAAELYAAALAFDPTDEGVFTALESALEATGAYEKLLPLYREQADTAPSDERRAALLHKRARIFAEVMEDRDAAIETFREILEVAPDDAAAATQLETMLSGLERWESLAEHLRGRVDRAMGTPAEAQLKLRLAELLEGKLEDVGGAIDVYDELVQVDPKSSAAVSALERLVQQPEHTLRITQILEPVYRQLDQWMKLVAIFEAQVELLEDPLERGRLLAEIGELHESRGGDATLALNAWARAFELDPHDELARSHCDRLAAQLEAWDGLVATYEAAIAKLDDPSFKSTLLLTVARLHDEKRGDPREAITAYERLMEHDPDDPTPLDALESLHMMVGDWRGLTRVFERKVEQSYDPQERAELLRRIGSIYEELLLDHEAAIEAYRRATEEDDTDDAAFGALDRLYAAERRWEALEAVLARRIELADVPTERASLGLRRAALLERELVRVEQAIEAYQRVLDDDAASLPAIDALARLYQSRGMWPELLENLEQQAALATEEPRRVELRCRMGQLLERELNDVFEAIERYRLALEGDPAHGASIDALMRIARMPDYRTQAAEIVEPLLRAQERWDDLVQLIEGSLDAVADPIDRRNELQRLAEVHEHGRGNARDAFGALARALREDPAEEVILEDLERLARGLGAWSDLADALGELAGRAPDPTLAAALYGRLARVCEEELADDARAIDAWVHAAEHDDDSTETLVHLDRLYEKAERWQPLVDVLERRIAAAADPAERTDLLIRLGNVKQQRFSDVEGAFVAFKEVLESDPAEPRALEGMERLGEDDTLAAEVLEVLDGCYREIGALEKVAGLYDIKIRLAESAAEQTRLLHEAAAVWEKDLGDPARALLNVRRVFELDPEDASALEEVERLAEAAGSWEGVRGLVEGLVEAGRIEGAQKLELSLRAAGWYRERLGDAAGEEACLRSVLDVEPGRVESHARLVELLRPAGREADLAAALRAWASVEPDAAAKVERLREASAIFESLSDVDAAAECHEAVLAQDPDDVGALDALARTRAAQGRQEDVASLLERRLPLTADAAERLQLRYRLAELHEGDLKDVDAAVASYRAVLEEAPAETRAIEALDRLFEAGARWQDQRELLERRVAGADDVADRCGLRLRLAALLERHFDDVDGAIALLNEVRADEPDHAQAARELERLYVAEERHGDLVALWSAQAERAGARGDADAEVGLWRRVAETRESTLGDMAGAIEAWKRVHELLPQDVEALQALVRLAEATEQWAEMAARLGALGRLEQGAAAVATAHRLAELAIERLQDRDQAEAALLFALGVEPGHAETRAKLKALYQDTEAWDKLAQMLAEEEPALADAAEKVELLKQISSLHAERLGNPAVAAEYLRRAVELAPDDREVLLALCDLHIAAGQARDAIPLLEKVIESYGGRRAKEVAVYHHRLGQAHEGLGDPEAAMAHYDAAFKIDLTNATILRDLGRLCLDKGDLERAQKTYRALLLQKLGPDVGIEKADVYFHLGDISFKQGDKMKAKAMLERAISEAGEHAAAQALLDQL